MTLLHFSLFSIMSHRHVLDLLLQLVYKVAALALKHLNLRLKVLDLGLVVDSRFFCPPYFFLFFIFYPGQIGFQIGYFFLQFSYMFI